MTNTVPESPDFVSPRRCSCLFLTACAAMLQIVSLIPIEAWSNPAPLLPDLLNETRSLMLIALPLSAMGSLTIRLADEFGVRRVTSVLIASEQRRAGDVQSPDEICCRGKCRD